VFSDGEAAGDARSTAFENAITPAGPVTERELARSGPRRLLFYARPEPHAARNMFELGVLALSHALAAGAFSGAWEFHGTGTVGGPSRVSLGGGASLDMHSRQTQAEYRGFLKAHDVGLSLMYTPHPSLVPIEMASAGMLVVTNSFANKTPERLRAISTNMIVAEPAIDAIARALSDAAAGAADLARRAAGSHVAWSTRWDESFNETVMQRIEILLAAGSGTRAG
jgi:hypothetical protein